MSEGHTDSIRQPDPCPYCGAARYWSVNMTTIDAVCTYCGRRGAHDNLTLKDIGYSASTDSARRGQEE